MRKRKRIRWNGGWPNLVKLAVVVGISGVSAWSCNRNSFEGKIVAVELAGEAYVYDGARLIAIDPENTGNPARVLTGDFASACAPNVDHEGRTLIFQAKQSNTDPWQIWAMDLRSKKASRVTHLDESCTDPVSLPDGTVIFSRESAVEGLKVQDLWRCQKDGSGLARLTFDPSVNLHSTVLKEGRVLYTRSVQYPDPRLPAMMVMRPDGTKSEIYFNGCCEVYPASGGTESEEGYIYFIGSGGELARVLHKRPLHTFEDLSAGLSGQFSAVVPDGSACLVSYRPSQDVVFGLYRFHPESRETPSLLYQGVKHLTDPVLIAAMSERPRILPSNVNPDNPTGLLMSQDINHSQEPVHAGITGDTVADRIRVSTLDRELGIVEAKADGSFYLKLDSDIPIRIETLNSQGETVRGPSDWFYLRPNERRGCVGCHADPELAPENIQPYAVKEDPVVLASKEMDASLKMDTSH